MLLGQDDDTIAAVATAPGTGGIGVVRISGSQALAAARKLAPFLPEHIESHRVYFGTLVNPMGGEAIDEVLVTYFAFGRSFTGEEVVEISCHGGEWIVKQVLQTILLHGVRLAQKGEFTFRAFSNGKLDLVQAESVLTLIESRSKQSARAAMNQLKGHLSKDLNRILDEVTFVAANLEANIDFAQEDIVVADNSLLVARLQKALEETKKLLATELSGSLFREGYSVALAGLPNVGKSSLLNAILEEERAIVTPVAGTTRDLIEGSRDFFGHRVNFIDTAGLRETEEMIEAIGIERARATLNRVDLILFVYDGSSFRQSLEEFERLPVELKAKALLVRNKADLDMDEEDNLNPFSVTNAHIKVSALSGLGLKLIFDEISTRLKSLLADDTSVVISARHAELLRKVSQSVGSSLRLLEADESPDLVAAELSEGVFAIHELLGLRYDDQVMDRVFNEFCLGK